MNIDVIVLIILGIIFAFTAYRYGKSFLVAFIISFYPAYFLYDIAKQHIENQQGTTVVAVFAVVYCLMLYILRKNISTGYSYGGASIFASIILSLGAIAQLAFLYYVYLPQLAAIYNTSGSIDSFFSGTLSSTILVIIPFIALFVSARD